MSASVQTIATLVGELKFRADSRPLLQFERLLDQVAKKMQLLEAQAKRLSKLGASSASKKTGGPSSKTGAEREFRLERALQAARRETFQAELANQKLRYAGFIEQQRYQSAALKQAQQLAILEAKQARAAEARLRTSGQETKNANALLAAKARQERLEQMLAQQQARTNAAKQAELRAMNAVQRAELQLQQMRAKGARDAARYAEQRAAAQRAEAQRNASNAANEQRRQASAAHAAERLRMSQERHRMAQADWEARRSSGGPAGSRFGAGFDVAALIRNNPIVAASAGVATALYALEARIQKTVSNIGQAEQYNNTYVQIAGTNPDNQRYARERLEAIADRYGTAIDQQTLDSLSPTIAAMTSGGIMSLPKALDRIETQLAAFRGAAMSKVAQDRANTQLSQVRAIGYASTEDFKTFTESAPVIAQSIVQAWGKRTNYQGNPEGQMAAFRKAIPDGNVLKDDFENGMALFVKNNKELIEVQSRSINATAQRLENERFLQQQELNSSKEATQAALERIQADREFVKAMKPVNETLAQFDIWLTRISSRLLNNFFKPKEVQELEKTVQMRKEKLDSIPEGTRPDYGPAIEARNSYDKALRDLAQAQANVGMQFPDAPNYLKAEGERAPALMLPDRMNKALEGVSRFSQPQQLVQPINRSTIDNRSVTVAKIEINGTDLSLADISTQLESTIQDIARNAFSDGMDGQLNNTAIDLTPTKR